MATLIQQEDTKTARLAMLRNDLNALTSRQCSPELKQIIRRIIRQIELIKEP